MGGDVPAGPWPSSPGAVAETMRIGKEGGDAELLQCLSPTGEVPAQIGVSQLR